MTRHDRPTTIKEAGLCGDARASANNTLPANPRQIYYAARDPVLETTSQSALNSQYFMQTLLVDYVEEQGIDWDLVWDDRGHFREPHTDREIGLGTELGPALPLPSCRQRDNASSTDLTIGNRANGRLLR